MTNVFDCKCLSWHDLWKTAYDHKCQWAEADSENENAPVKIIACLARGCKCPKERTLSDDQVLIMFRNVVFAKRVTCVLVDVEPAPKGLQVEGGKRRRTYVPPVTNRLLRRNERTESAPIDVVSLRGMGDLTRLTVDVVLHSLRDSSSRMASIAELGKRDISRHEDASVLQMRSIP
jgi:hypothetical protein